MGLNDTPSGERTRIAFFGVCNAGKSSLVNAITNQSLSVISDIAGTTTDIVRKNMELLPLGPVTIIDTPGINDTSELGQKRAEKTRSILRTCDIAVLVADITHDLTDADKAMLQIFKEQQTPYIIAWNKSDLLTKEKLNSFIKNDNESIVSAQSGTGIHELKELTGSLNDKKATNSRKLVSDLLNKGDVVVLVIPIDESAPKGRIILPQQMVIRDCLDAHAIPICCQTQELSRTLELLASDPRLVITDSQAFREVSKIVPDHIHLTSFSILMARYKGELDILRQSVSVLGQLHDESNVLICEACTHHRQCEDIGTVKIPAMIRKCCGANPQFAFASGNDFPQNLDNYDVVIHCGACMITEKEMHARLQAAKCNSVPIVNYGIAIAYMNGILSRATEIFS